MSCEGWGDGDKCIIPYDESTQMIGAVIEVDKKKHRLLVKYNKATALLAKIKGLNESKHIQDAFWIEAHLAEKVLEHGA